MKNWFDSRQWHIWVSLILAVPILIVAVTAVFIAHGKTLALDDIPVAAGWLPGYASERTGPNRMEPRASLATAAGERYVGTQGGLYRLEQGQGVAVEALSGIQIRALEEAPWGVVVAAKNGIWLGRAGGWQRVREGDAWSVSVGPDGHAVVALKGEGLLSSQDGMHWAPDAQLMSALAAIPPAAHAEAVTLGKLVMDLHTGKAFFGKRLEWVWIDVIGLAMSLLALTGVYMWWRNERRKAAVQTGSARIGVDGGTAAAVDATGESVA